MDFTIGLNIGDDGKILIHIRIPEDEGFTISEAERFRDLLDKQITVASPPKIRFAPDSPLEEDGFEPSVPRQQDLCKDRNRRRSRAPGAPG